MNTKQRLTLRAAQAIREAIVCRITQDQYWTLPEPAWNECNRLARLIGNAKWRGWANARRNLEQQLTRSVAECIDELVQVRTRLDGGHRVANVPTERDIFADLRALNTEFDEVQIDIPNTTIAVETDRIVLRKIDLGPFRIVLDWSKLSRHRLYQVIAQDPNPAASSSETTHPHVRDGYLCEGDGQLPIRNALQQGRLLDFFILVRQVLETYSPDTAYVKLTDWDGRDCADCGRLVRDDDCVRCERCGDEVCSDCSTSCNNCFEHFCSSHAGTCGGCDESFCNRCLAACQACGGKFCKECLDEKKCPNCRQRDEDACESGEADESDEFDAADAGDADDSGGSFHPVRLGQAAVLA